MRWFVRGDVDGFFGLALDNLVQLLLIDTLCRHVLGFSSQLLYGQVLPGVAGLRAKRMAAMAINSPSTSVSMWPLSASSASEPVTRQPTTSATMYAAYHSGPLRGSMVSMAPRVSFEP